MNLIKIFKQHSEAIHAVTNIDNTDYPLCLFTNAIINSH